MCRCCRKCNKSIDDGYSHICNECSKNKAFPEKFLYGYAYTPRQYMNKTFNPENGLSHGTIFPELVSPYCPGQAMDFIETLKIRGTENGEL